MRRLIVVGLVVVLVAVMSAPAALFAMGDNNNNGGNDDCKKKHSGKCEYPQKKVKICHIPPGNPDNAHTIRVSQNAVAAHLAHEDTLGKCPPKQDNGNNNGNNNGDDRR